jgi:hypothetical protein
MNAPARKLRPGDYFRQYRPRGDTLRAKAARSQIETGRRPISLPRILFLELSGEALTDALAAKRGRS